MLDHLEKVFDKKSIYNLNGWEAFRLGYALAILNFELKEVFEFEILREFRVYFERLLQGKKRKYRIIEQNGPNIVVEVLGEQGK